MCPFPFDKAWKLFIYGFNDFCHLKIAGNWCSRKAENAISETLYFKIFCGSMPPDPSSSPRLLRSWLPPPPPLNLTLLRHCIFSKACKEVKMGNSLQQYRLVVGIYWSAFCLFHWLVAKEFRRCAWVSSTQSLLFGRRLSLRATRLAAIFIGTCYELV